MKLTVLTWLRDSSVTLVGRTIELLFRIILFFLPLGVYLLIVQSSEKASKISSINVYTKDESRWQHVFPGFILVSIEPDSFKSAWIRRKANFQSWVASNKYLLEVLFMILIIVLMVVSGVVK